MDAFRGKTHILLSVTVIIFLLKKFDPLILHNTAFWFWLIVGSMLPDCDNRYAPAGFILPLWIFDPKQNFAYRGRFKIEHRTWTHSLLWIAAAAPLTFISIPLGLGLMAGEFLHIFFDWFTMMGVPWCYPFKKKRYSWKLFEVKKHDGAMRAAATLSIIYQIFPGIFR